MVVCSARSHRGIATNTLLATTTSNSAHPSASLGEHPAEVALAATGVENPLPGDVTKHAKDHWIEQMTLLKTTVRVKLGQRRSAHQPPLSYALIL